MILGGHGIDVRTKAAKITLEKLVVNQQFQIHHIERDPQSNKQCHASCYQNEMILTRMPTLSPWSAGVLGSSPGCGLGNM